MVFSMTMDRVGIAITVLCAVASLVLGYTVSAGKYTKLGNWLFASNPPDALLWLVIGATIGVCASVIVGRIWR